MINDKNVDLKNQRLISNQLLSDFIKESNEPNPINIFTDCNENNFESNEFGLDKKLDSKAFNFNQNDKKQLDKNLINLNDKKMFLNRNLIYESTSNLNGSTLMNGFQNGNQINGNLISNQINNNQISQLNHHINQLNNSQLNSQKLNATNQVNGHQINSHLIQETKQSNNQIITGNAYSNYPFNIHDTIIAGKYGSSLLLHLFFFKFQ